MKKIILIAVIFVATWTYNQKQNQHSQSIDSEPTELLVETAHASQESHFKTETIFQCDGRQHCSQMTSLTEAEFFIRNCPNTKMDGDNDGIPCENDSRF